MPETKYGWFLYANEKGELRNECPKLTQSWQDLIDYSQTISDGMPELLLKKPHLVLLLIYIYPHRFNEESARLLLNKLLPPRPG